MLTAICQLLSLTPLLSSFASVSPGHLDHLGAAGSSFRGPQENIGVSKVVANESLIFRIQPWIDLIHGFVGGLFSQFRQMISAVMPAKGDQVVAIKVLPHAGAVRLFFFL